MIKRREEERHPTPGTDVRARWCRMCLGHQESSNSSSGSGRNYEPVKKGLKEKDNCRVNMEDQLRQREPGGRKLTER